eukprot:1196293-Prorocentrum_minimum.AAC.3
MTISPVLAYGTTHYTRWPADRKLVSALGQTVVNTSRPHPALCGASMRLAGVEMHGGTADAGDTAGASATRADPPRARPARRNPAAKVAKPPLSVNSQQSTVNSQQSSAEQHLDSGTIGTFGAQQTAGVTHHLQGDHQGSTRTPKN